uniref:Longitudinals lacking protein, isoforms J/P/Q/S/Z n=2 Tax=Culex pipiens TaxID=7175 RepID=A0A8D8F6Q8_CULPI
MAAQDAVGGPHRDAQDDSSSLGGGYTKIKLESFNLWSDSDFVAMTDQSMNSSAGGSPQPQPATYVPVWRCKTSKSTSRIRVATKKTSSSFSAGFGASPKKESVRGASSNACLNSSTSSVGSTTTDNGTGVPRKEDKIVFQHENDTKPWKCKTCGRNYKWKNSLKCHIKNECGVPPKYFCERMCGYKTHIHSNLKRHLNSKFCKPN